MKIAIVTLPVGTNYGCILQAYALQQVLKNQGHNVTVLKIEEERKILPKIKFRCFLKLIKKKLYFIFRANRFYERSKEDNLLIFSKMQLFVSKNINLRTLNDINEIKEHEYDAFVVGSDQIWRPKYFIDGKISISYLDFAESWSNLKRISYAASFGTDEWEYDELTTFHCKKLLKLFDGVSVREFSGVRLCKDKFGVDAVQLIDPTFLLSKELYMSLLPQKKGNKKYILSYILDSNDDKNKLLSFLTKNLSLPVKNIFKNRSRYGKIKDSQINLSVEDWLQSFIDSEYVIADSFHACVFSLIFHKPFIIYMNEERGISRFKTLSRLFNIEDRFITSSNFDFYKIKPINWYKIDQEKKKLSDIAIEFLSKNL